MKNDVISKKLARRKNESLFRSRYVVKSVGKNKVDIDDRACIDFSSNDYLGLKKHPKTSAALIKACREYGFGSGASAFVSGYSSLHKEVEEKFAYWLGVDKAVLFSSGYSANVSIVGALSQRADTIVSDKLCHASILDGIQLSRARHIRYQHNDAKHLEKIVVKYLPSLIMTESIFSMEGDIAPIADLARIAKQHDSGLIIDDAHGVGVLGKSAKGVSEQFSLTQNDFTCLVIPLGKAFNAMGAMVAGRNDVIEMVLQYSRGYCYSTALPPAICYALQTCLEVISEETWRLQKLRRNISFLIDYAAHKGLQLSKADKTPVKTILTHDSEKTLLLQQWLLSKGFFVSAIRPPTVPKNMARLRLSINALHTKNQIIQMVDCIVEGIIGGK